MTSFSNAVAPARTEGTRSSIGAQQPWLRLLPSIHECILCKLVWQPGSTYRFVTSISESVALLADPARAADHPPPICAAAQITAPQPDLARSAPALSHRAATMGVPVASAHVGGCWAAGGAPPPTTRARATARTTARWYRRAGTSTNNYCYIQLYSCALCTRTSCM